MNHVNEPSDAVSADGSLPQWELCEVMSPSTRTKQSACAGAAVEVGPDEAYYAYQMRQGGDEVRIATDKRKGLSFQLWPSALALTAYVEASHARRPGAWRGKRVLELGAGCGLVGIVFAALGAHVTLTDMESVLPMLRENIELNREVISRGGGSAQCRTLMWGQPAPGDLCKPDIIVAADVIYHKVLFDPLLQSLRELTTTGDQVLLAHVRRWKTDAQFFKKSRKWFGIEPLPLTKDDAQEEGEVAHGAGSPNEGDPRQQQQQLGSRGSQLLLRLVRK